MKNGALDLYAGFWKRATAFALDYVIIALYLATLTLISLLLNSFFGVAQWLFSDRVRAQLSGFLLITLPITLYFAFSESSHRRATWGKAKVRVQVTDYHGERIGFWRSLARTALKFVPWELSHTLIWQITFFPMNSPAWVNYGFVLVYGLIGLNLAGILFTKQHQSIYDLLAKTYVIKLRR